MSSVIQLRDLQKSYFMAGQAIPVLKGINLDIISNEYVALMGPSGSGKSTLMNILGCLDSPTKGMYNLNGQLVKNCINQIDSKGKHSIRISLENFIPGVYQLHFKTGSQLNIYQIIVSK